MSPITFQSDIDPSYSVKVYDAGYWFYLTESGDPIESHQVPRVIREELGPLAKSYLA